jgi:MYXO-CTERM domain-containing protein
MSMVDQSEVTWSGFGTGYQIIGSDGNFEIVPVPEPSAVFGALALLGLAGYRERRRAAALRQASRQV